MVKAKKVVTVVDGKTITWDRFVHLWDTDTPSREFVKNRFRDLNNGKHEWIPTDYLLEVVWRIVDTAGVLRQEHTWVPSSIRSTNLR